MSDFSIFGRILRLALGIAAPVGWLYFAPFHKVFAAPFGSRPSDTRRAALSG